MGAHYILGRGRSRQPNVIKEYYYWVDDFLVVQELNSRFNELIMKHLMLYTSLDLATNTRNSTLIIFACYERFFILMISLSKKDEHLYLTMKLSKI
ncbi:hypothetical protein CR513_38299, partial [Mucuna pruriens]